MLTKSSVRSVALAALLAVAGVAQAAVSIYTTPAAFAAATNAAGVDSFAGLDVTQTTPAPLARTAGAYSYSVSSISLDGSVSSFFGSGTTGDPALSTNYATDTITFTSFSSSVRGVGGNFFGSDINGLFASADIVLTITDASGTTSQTLIAPAQNSFFGFVSDSVITSFTVSSVQPVTGFLWASVDNFTLAAEVTPIPEASTYAMLLAGLGAVGFVARRRRA